MQKQKKPFYGKMTKNKVVEDYLNSSASMEELARLHGILGSNTVANRLRKYVNSSRHLALSKNTDFLRN